MLFAVLRVCDEPLRELLLDQLVLLVMVVRQHIRRFLPDLLGLLGEFWGLSPRTQHTCLKVSDVLFCCVCVGGGGGCLLVCVCVYGRVGYWCVGLDWALRAVEPVWGCRVAAQ